MTAAARKLRTLANAGKYAASGAELLALDWAQARTRPYWNQARRHLRTLHFRAHAALPEVSLHELLSNLSTNASAICLPPASLDCAGVGDPAYYHALGAICAALQPKTILEIGTYLGVGTLCMALNSAQDCKIWTLDLPDEPGRIDVHLDDSDRSLVQRSRNRVGTAYREHEVNRRITELRSDSRRVIFKDHIHSTVDLVLIDGGHTLELVKSDTEKAMQLIGPHSVVLWDDYWWMYPDVVRYLDSIQLVPLFRIENTNLVVHLGPEHGDGPRSLHA